MPTIAVYVPAGAFRTLHEDKILVRGIARKAVEDAAAKLVAEGWPVGPDVTPKPSRAEKDFATEDPVDDTVEADDPVDEPDAWVAPLFVPVARDDNVEPDFKKPKR